MMNPKKGGENYVNPVSRLFRAARLQNETAPEKILI